ncbi:MAG: hypothetical protein COA44_03065 [Arcobacter sp.]|nr:MAG: hypothetical protein COA44_03065 [Arcobacter sp.]
MLHSKIIILMLLFVSFTYAEVTKGKQLFNEGSCLECHNHEDFGTKKSKIKMFKQLEARVQACQLAGNDGLFDDEVHDLSKYLNKDFYKLKK